MGTDQPWLSGSRDQRDITYWKREEPQATVLKTQSRALGVLETFELALPEATEERMAGFPWSPQRGNRELCLVFQKNL